MHNTLFDRIGILGVRANPHVLNKPICHTMSVPIILEAADVVGCTDAKSGRQEWIWKHDVVVGQFNNAKRGAILMLFYTPNNCLDILLKATENSIAIE